MMLIKGSVGGKPLSFEELLQSFSKSSARNRILKTISTSGYYTNGVMLTRLLSKELELVSKLHFDALFTDSEYKQAKPLNVLQAIPKYLRVEVKVAKLINGNDKLKLVRLEGDGVKSYIEDGSFSSFYHRISQLMPGRCLESDTSWWLSRKGGPIVVMDTGSFFQGRLLGTVAQYPVEQKEEIDFGKAMWKRHNKNGWGYKEFRSKG